MKFQKVSRPHTLSFLFVGVCERTSLRASSLPKDKDELKARITEGVATIDNTMLERIWNKLNCWLVVCRVANGAHIEDL